MSLKEGDTAPSFDLPTDGGGQVSSGGLAGKPYVIYFYPKDDTSGCTKEAIGFSEIYGDLRQLGVELIGVSKDSVASHDKFKRKYELSFPLGSDATSGVVEAFGAWAEKSMYGKKYMGIERSTFLVDGGGTIRKVWRGVKVPGHVEEVMVEAKTLAGG